MTRRDILTRLTGMGVLATGWATCLWLRALMPAEPHDPTLAELALILASFVLTLAGTLLVLHGAKLRKDYDARRDPETTRPRSKS